jgi:ATP-dependent RNA helicase RhlE
MKFEDYRIADNIKQSLAELGFKRPTDIQFKSIPPILRGEDVLAIAQTGTGKTAAFLLPILHKLMSEEHTDSEVHALIMVPTRELAVQIEQ